MGQHALGGVDELVESRAVRPHWLLKAVYDGEIVPQSREVNEHRWVSVDHIQHDADKGKSMRSRSRGAWVYISSKTDPLHVI
jgi:hypothetical protein